MTSVADCSSLNPLLYFSHKRTRVAQEMIRSDMSGANPMKDKISPNFLGRGVTSMLIRTIQYTI